MPLTHQPAPSHLRRVVVTGAAGFIGSHLSRALLEAGTTVIGIDRRHQQHDATAAANLTELLAFPNFVPVTADLMACPLDPVLLDADAVFHLAALPGVRPSWGPEFDAYVAANIQSTQRLMASAYRLGIRRVVLASSSSVYGTTDGSPSSETDCPAPLSPYAVTKLAAEHLCLAHAARPDTTTSVVALRYFTVYGPRQRPDMLIHRVLTSALRQTPLHLFGNGLQQRDFTYVDDVVRATIAAALTPTANTVLNVGSANSTAVTEVLDIAHRLTGRPASVAQARSRPGDVSATLADISRAHEVLGWKPEVTLVEGMERQLRCLEGAG
ncbi:UDP-glucose 4-epimerase [Actinobacteria bacterium OK074]|nr:UDP-glucose 4-epimerase [Actinobacteria bacterium OK074]